MVDARAKPPKVRLGVKADDVDLGDVLAQLEAKVPLDGELDMLVDLTATGSSPRALAASLQGEWSLAIGRGHIRTSLLDLAAVDFGDWMFSKSARKGFSDLTCFIARFDFHDGLGKSDTLLIDTPKVRVLGKGDIDLRKETIDLKFKPRSKKKHLIDVTTPFAIVGPLASPSVKVSTPGIVARMVGEIVLTPAHLLESLLPVVNDRGKDSGHPCLTLEDLAQPQ